MGGQRMRLATLAALAVVLAACSSGTATEESTTTTVADTATTTQATTTTTRPQPTTTAYEPKLFDFEIELIVIEGQCLGTAGAVITVLPQLIAKDRRAMTGDWLIVYEISGVELGAGTYNIEVSDGMYDQSGVLLTTESCDYDLSAEVTRILAR